ncbi:MAG TPA: hypothetical protein VE130_03710 [Nitrososphaeraceae archaeon]|nr:hypothetical protein [Nitrososphaeraceae archaeon]
MGLPFSEKVIGMVLMLTAVIPSVVAITTIRNAILTRYKTAEVKSGSNFISQNVFIRLMQYELYLEEFLAPNSKWI